MKNMKNNTRSLLDKEEDKFIPIRPLNTVRLASLEHTPGSMNKKELVPILALPLGKKKLKPLQQTLDSTNTKELVSIPVLPLGKIKLKSLQHTPRSTTKPDDAGSSAVFLGRLTSLAVVQRPISGKKEQNESVCQASLEDLLAESLNFQERGLLNGTPVSCGDDPTPYSEQDVDGVIQWEHFDKSAMSLQDENETLSASVRRQNFVSRASTPESSVFEKKNVSCDDKKYGNSTESHSRYLSSPNLLSKPSISDATKKSTVTQRVQQAQQADHLYSEAHVKTRLWSPAIWPTAGYCPIDPVAPCEHVTPSEQIAGYQNQNRQQTSSHSGRMFTPSNKRQQLKDESRAQRSSLTVNPSSNSTPSGNAANTVHVTFSPLKIHGELEVQSLEDVTLDDKSLRVR